MYLIHVYIYIYIFFFGFGWGRSDNSKNYVSERNGATNSLSNAQIDIVLQPKSQNGYLNRKEDNS